MLFPVDLLFQIVDVLLYFIVALLVHDLDADRNIRDLALLAALLVVAVGVRVLLRLRIPLILRSDLEPVGLPQVALALAGF